jgi:hypothetical protein
MLLTGQCLCGNVKYECNADPLAMKYCHCDTCRRVTGSAFNIGVGVPAEDLKVSGKIQGYTHTNGVTREFCPVCGSPLFTRSPHIVWIRAGSLDSSEGLQPTAEMWTELAVPWARIPEGIPSYLQNSPSTVVKKK